MLTCRRLAGAVVGAFLGAVPLCAQTVITGTVIAEDGERPLEGVELILLDTEENRQGETLSDSDGWFRLIVPEAGSWIITGSMIGYRDIRSAPVDIDAQETVVVEVRMAVEAVPLEPLVVTSRISYFNADLVDFYDRMERGERSGFGRFVNRDDVDRMSPIEATDLLRTMSGIHLIEGSPGHGRGIRMSGGCVPAIFIDGSQINRFSFGDSLDDYVSPSSIEGIEVYRGAGQQVGRFYDPSGCGLVLVWTRRGTPTEGKLSWKKIAVGAGLLLTFILIGT